MTPIQKPLSRTSRSTQTPAQATSVRVDAAAASDYNQMATVFKVPANCTFIVRHWDEPTTYEEKYIVNQAQAAATSPVQNQVMEGLLTKGKEEVLGAGCVQANTDERQKKERRDAFIEQLLTQLRGVRQYLDSEGILEVLRLLDAEFG